MSGFTEGETMSKAARVEIPGLPTTSEKECPYLRDAFNKAQNQQYWDCTLSGKRCGPDCPGPGVKLLIGEEKLTREALKDIIREYVCVQDPGEADVADAIDALRAHLGVTDG